MSLPYQRPAPVRHMPIWSRSWRWSIPYRIRHRWSFPYRPENWRIRSIRTVLWWRKSMKTYVSSYYRAVQIRRKRSPKWRKLRTSSSVHPAGSKIFSSPMSCAWTLCRCMSSMKRIWLWNMAFWRTSMWSSPIWWKIRKSCVSLQPSPKSSTVLSRSIWTIPRSSVSMIRKGIRISPTS